MNGIVVSIKIKSTPDSATVSEDEILAANKAALPTVNRKLFSGRICNKEIPGTPFN